MIIYFRSLKINKTLKTINLMKNQITGDINLLGELLLNNNTIETIILTNNQITGNISNLNLSKNKTIRKINLGMNQIIGDISSLNKILSKNNTLKYISIYNNNITFTNSVKYDKRINFQLRKYPL